MLNAAHDSLYLLQNNKKSFERKAHPKKSSKLCRVGMRWSKQWKEIYQVKDVHKRFNSIFIHGMDMLLHPFAQNQIQLQEPSLLAPIY